jgi:hypothetical protein
MSAIILSTKKGSTTNFDENQAGINLAILLFDLKLCIKLDHFKQEE